MRILVVEDEPAIAELVREVGSRAGHQVLVAIRGTDAIQAALMQDFDLLVCDLLLPDLPGIEVIRALKAQAPQLPVIVVSALDPLEMSAKVADAGASTFLQKPLRLEQLSDEITLVAASRAGLRVMVIDADPIYRVRLAKTLEPLGCEVLAYAAPAQAKSIAATTKPSLVMLDGSFADALDTVRWAHAANIPVFVYTEPAGKAREDEFMRAGASLFLTKPIDTEGLLTQAHFLAGM